ncbi:MAG TPA: GNAT family N-acetyltransferase [Chloroflexota bacterium]|nr:GNAT family N-acetyltransferase [Chloroflexota bacterium]
MSESIGAMSEAVVVREVTDPSDPAIVGFGRMQRAAYFAPETLIPAEYIPQMLGGGGQTGSRRNFLVVAELDGRVVGGTLFHWLAEAGSGFSSFMGVDRQVRRRGIARRMHEERFRTLDRAAGGWAPGVFIDVVNPSRMPSSELDRERAGSDPWDRRRAFARLGFGQVDIRYEQPVGGPHGGPVTILDLLYCPHEPTDSVPTSLVIATMQAYWSPWLGTTAARHHARELQSRAGGRTMLALISPLAEFSTSH